MTMVGRRKVSNGEKNLARARQNDHTLNMMADVEPDSMVWSRYPLGCARITN